MKKLIVFILITVFGTAITFGSDPKVATTQEELRNEIIKLLDAPKFDLEKEETLAQIRFTLNSKKEIVILSVESDNKQVDAYVKNELNYHKIENGNYERGKVFVMPLKIMKSKA
ncbi:hypothetical protein GTQ40_17835 [Flavobacteriaceae bacterium R38]|nr:hypothetical protein [Flavobacteriaceae bacterium R38]